MKLEAITAKNNVEDLLLQHIKIHQKYLDQTSENRKKVHGKKLYMKLKSWLIPTEIFTMGQITNYADYLLKTAKQVHKAATNKYTLFRYIFIFFICFTLCLN